MLAIERLVEDSNRSAAVGADFAQLDSPTRTFGANIHRGIVVAARDKQTATMKRLAPVVLLLLTSLAAGCAQQGLPPLWVPPQDSGLPVPTATPTSASPTVSATTSPPATDPGEFTVDGIGPYQIGATLSQLQAAGALVEVATGGATCPDNTTARGVPPWGDIQLSFRPGGRLNMVTSRSTSIPTPSGAYLGDTLAKLKAIYGSLGKELTQGGGKAFLVTTVSGRGVLFDFATGSTVMAMIAGDAAFLKSSYEGGTDFC